MFYQTTVFLEKEIKLEILEIAQTFQPLVSPKYGEFWGFFRF